MHSLPAHRSTLILSTLALLSSSVFAGPGGFLSPRPRPASQPASPSEFGLTGDWGGLRSSLRDAGVDVSAFYTGEWMNVVKGGKSRGSVFDGLAKLSLNARLDSLVGWQGATFRISALAPHGTSGSARHAGDLALFSNIDAYDSLRLVDFWIEQRLLDNQVSLKLGQMRVDDEFGVNNSALWFINNSFGTPNTPATSMPYANYPVGGLGIRLRVEPTENLYGQIGLYDGNPSSGDFADPTTGRFGNARRHGTDWALRHSEGFLWASEVGFQRSGSYPGAVRLGWLHHTDGFNRAALGLGSDGKTDGSSNSGYVIIEQTLWEKPDAPREGLNGFLCGIKAQESRNPMSYSQQAGLTYTGLATHEDKVGIAYAYNKISPLKTNPGGDSESVLELSYLYPIHSAVKVQPDLQIIRRPGGNTGNRDAWVLGVRAIVEF
ncbi:MAG: hypothetical protein RLZZ244_2800 [Verrucomicrobiota bacterium]|jgi:porin